MNIFVASRRKKPETIKREFGDDCMIIDVTSKGTDPWVKFSPFYPHGDIPVPRSSEIYSQSVEGIWQALKVFESGDVDPSKLKVANMKGIKRTVRSNGKCLGHRNGINGKELLSYIDARKQIYLPAYHWVLENKLQAELMQLKELAPSNVVVLLDYETNEDIENTSKPLSHAGVVKQFLIGGSSSDRKP